LNEKIKQLRENEVSKETRDRNASAMRSFMKVLGENFLVKDVRIAHVDQFKNARLESGIEYYASFNEAVCGHTDI